MNSEPTYDELVQRIKALEFEVNIHQSLDTQAGDGRFILDSFSNNAKELMGIIEVLDDETDLRYVWLNKAAGQFLGKPAADLRGMRASDTGATAQVVRLWIDECHKAALTGASEQFEYTRTFPDGVHTLLASTSKIRSRYFSFVVFDVTEQKRTEEALRASEKKYQSLFNNAQVALFRTSIEGSLLEINQRYAEISGYSTIEACMNQFNPAMAWADPDGRNKLIEILQEKGSVNDYEAKIIPRNGSHIWILFSATIYPEQGFIEGSLIEITDRKQIEDEIRKLNRDLELRVYQRTAQLEEVNKELEDFVYSVSHDLRAPLRSISGFSEIINRRHRLSLNEEGQHYFDNIIKASRQMGNLIDDLLKFSRLGRLSIKSEAILLNDVFKTAMDTLSDQIKKTGAHVTIPEQMPAVQGDLTLTTHVFINLLENALKYHKPDIPPVIDVGFELNTPHVIISIGDNGIGIDPAYHGKIFKMFQRLHGQAKYPGTGIGLAAVKKALQLMKGHIGVESELNRGSTFKITLLMTETASEHRTLQ